MNGGNLGYAEIAAAAVRIAGKVHRTPVITSRLLNAAAGCSLFLKAENLQRTGSFKLRGATNAVLQLPQARGVVTFSSGNHAQAIAYAARNAGIVACIIMPVDAPATKLAATQGYGAEIVFYDRYTQDRAAIAEELAVRRGMTLIPPFDHPHIIAGQGTAAAELLADVPDLDVLLVPLGGGGLLAGSALAATSLAQHCRVLGVEPAAGNDGQRSLREGRRVRIDVPRSIADGALTTELGVLNFSIMQRYVDDVETVGDDELITTMRLLAERAKLVTEPTGCLGVAYALRANAALAGKRVGAIVSGGNIDIKVFADLLA